MKMMWQLDLMKASISAVVASIITTCWLPGISHTFCTTSKHLAHVLMVLANICHHGLDAFHTFQSKQHLHTSPLATKTTLTGFVSKNEPQMSFFGSLFLFKLLCNSVI